MHFASGAFLCIMKLEDAIKQGKPFRSTREKLVVNLLYTCSWLQNELQGQMKAEGITVQQYNLLRILRGQYPAPASLVLIKERMIDKQSDVSRLLNRLVEKGLVSRASCAQDKRKLDVIITQLGQDIIAQIEATREQKTPITDALSDEEVNQLGELLEKLRSVTAS